MTETNACISIKIEGTNLTEEQLKDVINYLENEAKAKIKYLNAGYQTYGEAIPPREFELSKLDKNCPSLFVFLNINNAWELFCRNFDQERFNKALKEWDEQEVYKNPIIYAFCWAWADQGHAFWLDLHERFKIFRTKQENAEAVAGA